ncbi:ribonuclease HII [Limibacillus halophilus]|uniref:Ribonuclease HII n=1 Tax=Limibacillus halophilus TaxID=1579333 RepID=A0A839SWR2_9PROT|nr:ribonuclease HII [Limibacillus halophilus]MBB3065956.1 ribonuclease HII [Limibacillus halophilus]
MPDYRLEEVWIERGLSPVAGVDEAGRGPLAGPVVAAAVILDIAVLDPRLLAQLNDSKKLSPSKRESLNQFLQGNACVGVGQASVEEIDRINILQATFLAMRRAVASLPCRPAALLIDGNRLPPEMGSPADTVVKGDSRSLSIAAASIVAKVTRDLEMDRLAEQFPGYGWERNRGYGTADHLAALKSKGATLAHRRSFRPVFESLSITH